MKKRGVSAIIATVLIILISIAAAAMIWAFIIVFLEDAIEREMRSVELSREEMKISEAAFFIDGGGHPAVNLTIARGSTGLLGFETELITQTVSIEELIPIDIILVIDLSGSMTFNFDGYTTNRITRAKEATIDFIDEILDINEIAKVGVVGFRSNLMSSPSSDMYTYNLSDDLLALTDEVDSWTASGGTYLCKGMERALELFNEGSIPSREKIMIVLGDGDASIPACKNGGAESLSQDLYQDNNITISTIGFGPGVAIPLFEGIASSGNGLFYDSSDTTSLASSYESIVSNIEITTTITKEIPMEGVYLDAIIYAGGDSYTYPIPEQLPGVNGAKRFEIPLPAGVLQEDVTLIEIALSNIAQGNIATGRILSTWEPNN